MPNLNHLNQSQPREVAGPYIGRHAAADRTGLSTRYFERLFQDGAGPPASKIGRRVLYNVALLDAWMAERLVTSSSAATVRDAEAAP
jgi:predicted DNA-binding transcriptional regulator AlpA